jgi:hypothetical protein
MADADELSSAFGALVDALRRAEDRLLSANPPLDDVERAEGYRWLFSVLGVGLEAHLWADTDRPLFVEVVGPTLKWGGDNADAFYRYAPVDPRRTYVVRGRRGDAAYLSLTVYGGPHDGRYSERIVGQINDRELVIGDDGRFELILSPEEHPGNWLRLEPDAVCAITRDYLADPVKGRRADWSIEAVDPPATREVTPASVIRGFRAATTWLVEQSQLCPLRVDPPNEVQEPYPVPTTTFGWAAGDAAYAMGSYELDDDQALVIEGRSPDCAFWNLCLWNPFLHTFDYRYEQVTINGAQVDHEPDGSWRIVVAAADPGTPNWIRTQGHRRGLLWFRWFLPAATPERPKCTVVPLEA